MKIKQTSLPDIMTITPKRFKDYRGFFRESWNKQHLASYGINIDFVQDNHSFSKHAGTIRGLHFQSPPHAQDKLVSCNHGRLFDVAVDIRKGSPTYGDWVGEELSFENGKQLLIPKGFLHGFMTLEPNTEIIYKCSDYYVPECDGVVHWDTCGIGWPTKFETPIQSTKDRFAMTMSDFLSPFVYGYTS
jgi:dTDP-4-dehydrorhamnose 3,5-epimerase|tara:strand:- start:7050 stop:7613 length:564 start_codon:yes stop_codon:yes gene_type:complete